MTTLREAAQQALEALEYAQQDRECPSTTRQAITALRAALADGDKLSPGEPVQEPVAWEQFHEHMAGPFYRAPPQRPAEPVQEPVAWEQFHEHMAGPFYRAPPQRPAEPVQEPVAFIHRQGNHWEVSERHLDEDERDRGWTEEPLYTAPPQRKPLSEDEVLDIARTFGAQPWPPGSCVAFARAVERAHGIGENT